MLHKDLVGADLHVTKLHAATHVVAGTDPLVLTESQVTNLTPDLSAKVGTGDSRLSDARVASDVSAWAKNATKPAYASSEITNISAAGQALIDDADAAAQLATLGTAAYSEGTWTPVLNSFTVVGSAPAVSGTYRRIGNLVFVKCTILAGAGGNTSVACSGGNISGLPVSVASYAVCNVLNPSSGGSLGISTLVGTGIYPPTFAAQTNAIFIVGIYDA